MRNLFETTDQNLSMTLRSMRDELKARGWKEVNYVMGNRLFFHGTRPDGKTINFCSCTSPKTTYFSGKLANDKMATCKILEQLGVKTPETYFLSTTDESDRQEALDYLLEKYDKIVIKPTNGAHGFGVYADITNRTVAEEAVAKILAVDSNTSIIAQAQIRSRETEVRVICIDYKFVAAYSRIPAFVLGDGEHTVRELIDIENSTFRTAPYQSDRAFINVEAANEYIENHQIGDMVPAAGEEVRVIRICNTGCGGIMRDVSNDWTPEMRAEAEKIAKAFELPVIGIDYYDDYILEVNASPALYHPTGDPESALICIKKYVDHLETL